MTPKEVFKIWLKASIFNSENDLLASQHLTREHRKEIEGIVEAAIIFTYCIIFREGYLTRTREILEMDAKLNELNERIKNDTPQ